MLRLISVLCLASISFQLACSRPSTSKQIDKNGYKYEISHYPGSSNAHLIFGKNNQESQKPVYVPEKNKESLRSLQNSPHETNYPKYTENPRRLAESSVKPEKLIYDPLAHKESGDRFASPYDSVKKQDEGVYGGYDDLYEPSDSDSYLPPPSYSVPDASSKIPSHGPSGYYHSDPSSSSVNVVEEPPHYSKQPSEPHFYGKATNQVPISQHEVPVQLKQSYPKYIPSEFQPGPPSQPEISVPLQQSNIDYVPSAPQPGPLSQHVVAAPLEHTEPLPIVQHEIPLSNTKYPQQPKLVPIVPHDADVSPKLPHSNYISQPPVVAPISQTDVDVSLSSHDANIPLSYPRHLSGHGVDTPLILSNPNVNFHPVNPEPIGAISSHSIKTVPVDPISQTDVDVSLKSPDANLPLSYPPQFSSSNVDTPLILSNPTIDVHPVNPEPISVVPSYSIKTAPVVPISQTDVDVHSVDTPLISSDPIINVPSVNLEPIGVIPKHSIKTNPASPKYAFVPSGPAYTKDSFSAEIIHAAPNAGFPASPSANVEAKVQPPPVSHAFRLPLNPVAVSSIPESLPLTDTFEKPDVSPIGPIEPPIAPVSHSTRLLIPGHNFPLNSVETVPSPVKENYLPKEQNFPEFPSPNSLSSGPSETIPNHVSSGPQIPPVSHSFRLNLPQLSPGVLPEVPDIESEDKKIPSSLSSPSFGIPPPTHSFRLILPGIVPGTLSEEPKVSAPHNSDFSTQHNSGQVTPVSHSVRLVWPPNFPGENEPITPEVEYSQSSPNNNNFKSSDLPLLAVETKTV